MGRRSYHRQSLGSCRSIPNISEYTEILTLQDEDNGHLHTLDLCDGCDILFVPSVVWYLNSWLQFVRYSGSCKEGIGSLLHAMK